MDLTPNTFSAEQEADLEAAVRRWQARQCAENMQAEWVEPGLFTKGAHVALCIILASAIVGGGIAVAVLN